MLADNPRHRSGRKAATAALITPSLPVGHGNEWDVFLSLPDEIVTVILGLLDWHGRINMEATCRRLKTLVNHGPWMRRIHFTPNDLPTSFTTVLTRLRSEAVTELDVSHYVLANSHRLAAGIRLCRNLVVLRCVQSRLLPATLFLLLRDCLPRLECLYWSVLEPPDGFPLPSYAPGKLSKCDSKCLVVPPPLTRMYVEAISERASIEFVETALRHCHALRSLHFHERASKSLVYGAACRILYAIRSGTLDDFDEITYTREYASSNAFRPAYPLALRGNVFGDFGRYVEVYTNVTLKLGPGRSCNCVTLAELESPFGIKNHKQLTVFIAEGGEETISCLARAAFSATCRHIEALTLTSSLETAEMFSYKNISYQAALCNFITSCVALTELNISEFHFSKDFNCCSVIATGGLENLRSLALGPCALCNPRRLEHFSRASFKLLELDIRTGPSQVGCDVCDLDSTCDDASLASLCLLRHLTRLTLCDIDHARSLDFLVGCASLLDLRLRNMGMWRVGRRQDMSPIARLWTQLHTLKLESAFSPIDFTFFRNAPVAPKLSRLCLATVLPKDSAEDLLPSKLWPICPAANVIHLHAWYLEPDLDDDVFVLGAPFKRGDKMEEHTKELFISSADKAWLCTCLNCIGAPKQYGIN